MARLDGKIALVTGAASGIGKETALLLAREGARVVVADVQDARGAEVAAEIEKNGGTAFYQHLNVADESDWTLTMTKIEETYADLDILVNNAGISETDTLEEESMATYHKVIGVTQTGAFLGMKTAAALLKRSPAASVINVSSIFAASGGFGASPAYHAAKGAVRSLTKNIAIEWAPLNIRVNSVHPGFIDTPMMGDTDRAPLIAVTPLNRLGRPEEIATAILFLASDEASFVTGAELYADGGYLAR
jgi:NAD(P)-dependent dehydrogenase (short-subunit alcohol dehydrogenase family)